MIPTIIASPMIVMEVAIPAIAPLERPALIALAVSTVAVTVVTTVLPFAKVLVLIEVSGLLASPVCFEESEAAVDGADDLGKMSRRVAATVTQPSGPSSLAHPDRRRDPPTKFQGLGSGSGGFHV